MNEKELHVQRRQELHPEGESTKPQKQFLPAVDIYETDQAVTVIAEMPGVAKDGIEISLEEGVLTMVGQRSNGEERGKVLLREYESGCYRRRFTVSEAIDQEKIEAVMANGILTLILPKVAPARPRRIEVKGG